MKLIVGIPAYNEENTILDVINRIPGKIEGISETAVIVVDDGSTDRTRLRAEQAADLVVSHINNLGLGAAFQTIVRKSLEHNADILVTIDADGQFSPEDIPQLINPLLENRAQMCTASRFSDPELIPNMPWIKKWGNHKVSKIISTLTKKEFKDVSCGYRAYGLEALLKLTVYGKFTYTHETFLDLVAKGIHIKEIPLIVAGKRSFGTSHISSNLLRYGLNLTKTILRFYRDYYPLQLCLAISAPFLISGTGFLGYSLANFLESGSWTKWSAFVGAALLFNAVIIIFFGFLAEITLRLRKNQEEIIYWLRKNAHHKDKKQ